MLQLKPSEIRYSQDSICYTFREKCGHPFKPIIETLDDLINGQISVNDIKQIEVQKIGDQWYSADNRRLWIFKQLEKLGNIETIPVRVVEYIPFDKQTSINDGLSIEIRPGRDSVGRYFRVLENVLNDHETEIKTIIAKNEDWLNHLNSFIRQLRSENAKQLSENQDLKARSEEILNKLNLSKEINQKNITACKKIIAEMDCLNEKLRNTCVELSKPENELLNRENTTSSYVRSPHGGSKTAGADVSRPYVGSKTASKFEDNISVLELQLSGYKKDLQNQKEAYMTMEATYKEKLRSLESDNESLRNSNSVTKAAKYEAKIHSMKEELELVNENYGLLERHVKQIYDADTMTIEQLKNEIETIKKENDILKQTIGKKDKQMTEIRRQTVCLYGLVQQQES